ncbi:MAG: hypothetical protein RLZZ160_661, partial [Actinomycetota bacterium]
MAEALNIQRQSTGNRELQLFRKLELS